MIELGKKFKSGEQDCYTLGQEYFKEEFGIILPDFSRDLRSFLNNNNLFINNFKSLGFYKVSNIKKHDVILFQIVANIPDHIGIYIGDQYFIHHLVHNPSRKELYNGYYIDKTVMLLRRK